MKCDKCGLNFIDLDRNNEEEELRMLWDEYVLEKDASLPKDAIMLKWQVINHIAKCKSLTRSKKKISFDA